MTTYHEVFIVHMTYIMHRDISPSFGTSCSVLETTITWDALSQFTLDVLWRAGDALGGPAAPLSAATAETRR